MNKRFLILFLVVFIFAALILSGTLASAVSPVLYFSDLTSGPKTGNSDTSLGQIAGVDGAIVTIWGKNLGSSQGSSKVFLNGAEGRVYYWGNANSPANLYKSHGMQKISFQISHLASDGLGGIYVEIDGIQSNSLPFSVRAGNIYFVKTTGNDNTGTGSWQSPWKTILKAKNSLAAGDIAYIGNGVSQTTMDNYGATVNLDSHGQEGLPKALVAYPGAIVNVGSDSIGRAFHNWVSGCNPSCSARYWVISQLNITSRETGVYAVTGYRVIGNFFTAPFGDGQSGIVYGVENNLRILGNEFYNVGRPDGTKLYHTIYITGYRTGSAPRAATESNREIGWNYFHDNKANRAINIYSEQAYSAFIENHRVHDNLIVNQRGDGILMGYHITGENWVYNNIIINSGLGPDWNDGISSHVGIRVSAGHEQKSNTVIHIYNNLLYGNGDTNAYYGSSGQLELDQDAFSRATINFKNNIIYSLDSGDVYESGWSGTPPTGNYRNIWYGQGNAPSWDTGAINTNPIFVDASNNDFHLQQGSPAINAGIDVLSVVQRDFDGNTRPRGSAFDIGAYEFISATSYHPADTNQNNIVEMKELIAFIGLWKSNQANINDVMTALDRWLRGS